MGRDPRTQNANGLPVPLVYQLHSRQSRRRAQAESANGGRKILAAIRGQSAVRNDYYDGPFDQLADNYVDEIPISEYIIGTVIALTLDLLRTETGFRNGSWERTGTLSDPETMHGEVFGKTLGIIGYGLIGIETAKRAKSLGMKVYGINRKAKADIPQFLDWHGSIDELNKLLKAQELL